MLHVFINYDHDEPIMLINCIDHLQEHLKLSYNLYIISTETKDYLKDIESAVDCKILYNEKDYDNVIQTAVNDYKMFIDYGTMLTQDITPENVMSCYFYTNKLDYIYKESIPDKYLYDSCNNQTFDEFLQHPNIKYTHFDVCSNNCSATCYAGVVGIGKWEENYLEEWINYHLQLGFDKIYFYDNNEVDNTKQKEVCDKYPQVVYRDVQGWPTKQTKLYNYLQMYVYNNAYLNNDCKYLLFEDIDEFLVLKNNHNLHDLIRFKKYIHINWQIYGDNDQIYKDDRPVMERFSNPIIDKYNEYNKFIKSIIQTKNKIYFNNPHYCVSDLECKTPTGNKCNGSLSYIEPSDYENDYAIINHYYTKSAEEFIDKMIKGSADGKHVTHPRRYFEINKKTEDKVKFFKSRNPCKVLNVFVNYDHTDNNSINILTTCIQYLHSYINISHIIYVYTTPEEISSVQKLQSLWDFKYIHDEKTYQDTIKEIDELNEYKMFIDYGTMLTKSITNDNIHSCYLYTNKLDYICKGNEKPSGYFMIQ